MERKAEESKMTDIPKIDWSKPVEAFFDGAWQDVLAAVTDESGSLILDRDGDACVMISLGKFFRVVKPKNIRNKPKPLELWVNFRKDKATGVYETQERADAFAASTRTHCVRMVEDMSDE